MELDAVGKAIVQYHLVPLVHQANLGLEVTMHRVDAHGHLATTAPASVWISATKSSVTSGLFRKCFKVYYAGAS